MKYTTIESQGQKWLRPINVPYPNEDDQEEEGIFQLADAVLYKQMTADLLYIGSKPAGSTLDESEVREVRQFMIGGTIDMDDTIIEHGDWITMHDFDKARLEADLPDFLKRNAYTDAESHDHDISGWTHVSDALPEHLETVWLSNGKGFTTLGCLVWTEDGWHWAATNGVIYEEKGRIVSECESDDIDVEYWHRLPDALKIDKED